MVAPYVHVHVNVEPLHLDRPFTYRLPEYLRDPDRRRIFIGSMVRVPFHGKVVDGWVVGFAAETDLDEGRIHTVEELRYRFPVAGAADIQAWRWLATRYLSTFKSVARQASPSDMADVHPILLPWPTPYQVTARDGRRGTVTWMDAGWHDPLPERLAEHIGGLLAQHFQVKVITPLPACALSDRLKDRFDRYVVDARGLKPGEARNEAFWHWRLGNARLLLTTQHGGLWAGEDERHALTVVVDEANPGHKLKRRPYAHMREAALITTRTHGIDVILCGHVPSTNLAHLISTGHAGVDQVSAKEMKAHSPTVRVIDRTALAAKQRGRLSTPIRDAIQETVKENGRVIVLCAMKGSGKSLACTSCRSRRACPTCGGGVNSTDESTGVKGQHDWWACGTCSWEGPAFSCPFCGKEKVFLLRAGVALLGKELSDTYPDVEVRVMEGFNAPGPTRRPCIAVMTRGSVTAQPGWLGTSRADLLCIVDPEVVLGRTMVDAAEDGLRLWVDAAALADRVQIQTYEPEHPAIQAFAAHAPEQFWDKEITRRETLDLPPFRKVIALYEMGEPQAQQLRQVLTGLERTAVLGPGTDGLVLVLTPDLRPAINLIRPIINQWAEEGATVRVIVEPTTF